MKYTFFLISIYAVLCCSLAVVDNESSEIEEAVKKNDDASTEATAKTKTTTAPPIVPISKINVIKSDICRKCICDSNPNYSQIDCSGKKMSTLFSEEEWKILTNGDITFDTIMLEHNNITSLKAFPKYPVKNLYLGFNQIASIEKGAFANLTELTKLNLGYNKLTTKALDPDVFKGLYSEHDFLPLGKVIELDLGHNEIHSFDADLFEHLPKLETLILSGNTFQVIDQNTVTAISGLSFLKTLDMSFMELSELPDYLFHGPSDLDTIILTGNLFDELPDDLELAKNLRHLVLDENPIEDLIGENLFPQLTNLRYLSMSGMPELTQIGAGAFSELQNLTTLILSNNVKLSKINSKAFIQNTTNPEIFSFPPLEKLYLHNNNLTTLDRAMLERWDKISELDLRYNYWTCDCSNRWLIEVLMIQINNTNPLLAHDVNCDQPSVWRNVPLIALNTEKNHLKCSNGDGGSRVSLFLIGLLIGILLCIPILLGAIALWHRGCFGLNRNRVEANRSLYNRANFNEDDFHI